MNSLPIRYSTWCSYRSLKCFLLKYSALKYESVSNFAVNPRPILGRGYKVEITQKSYLALKIPFYFSLPIA